MATRQSRANLQVVHPFARQILRAVHREVDSPNEKLLFNLACEHSLATGLAVRHGLRAGALVAACPDDF